MKMSRKGLDRQTAVPQPYHSFFSFPKSKGGYSGVAVYCNPTAAVAVKAEEGLSGVPQPNPPVSPEERISRCYPSAPQLPLHGDDDGCVPSDLVVLDAEGRALVLDFGLFVLINVYCPNDASDMRMTFKMNFNLMLQERVRILISEGREVIVLGDINIALNPIDHSEGSLEEVFWNHPPREWLRNWLEPVGPMHDVIRRFWPNRKGMYTCMHTCFFGYGTTPC
jgi:AP endonuclease 2